MSNTLLSEAEEGLQGLAQRLKELEQGVSGSADVTRLTSEVAYLESELEVEMEVGSRERGVGGSLVCMGGKGKRCWVRCWGGGRYRGCAALAGARFACRPRCRCRQDAPGGSLRTCRDDVSSAQGMHLWPGHGMVVTPPPVAPSDVQFCEQAARRAALSEAELEKLKAQVGMWWGPLGLGIR